MARDKVAKDDMRWQGMEEGWQMDECHHSIGHWFCPMRCKGLSDASLGFWKTSEGRFEQEKVGLKRLGFGVYFWRKKLRVWS